MSISLFKSKANEALAKCKIKVNNDGTIDITGNLIVDFPLGYLPKINTCYGNLNCNFNEHIINLKNAPKVVTGNFSCKKCNSLKTLKGASQIVYGYFNCAACPALKTLEGAPTHVGGDFFCYNCDNLKSIQMAPTYVGGTIYYDNCNQLPLNAKSDWLQKQTDDKNRKKLETITTNQAESTWKHLK